MADKDGSMEPRGASGRTKRSSAERKAAVEELRRQQQRAERRKTLVIVAASVLVALALIAIPVSKIVYDRINDPSQQATESFGVPVAQAGCDPEIVDDATGSSDHVPVGTRIDYPTAPPSSGRHAERTAEPKALYGPDEDVQVEQLVHNLEHGYLVIWYDSELPEDQRSDLEALVKRLRKGEPTTGGFAMAAPWPSDEGRPPFPEGKNIAFTRWGQTVKNGGAGKSWRQYCTSVSGEAAKAFSVAHPAQDAPEFGVG